ncbi:MAG: isochorismate lyase [Leptolyngbyaceae cyanobacterium]
MKSPEACASLLDIRTEIDRIDRAVIALWAERFTYVKAAAPFKSTQHQVAAPERLQAMLQQRREWAIVANLNPDVIEQLYRDLVNYFINEEMQHWRSSADSQD